MIGSKIRQQAAFSFQNHITFDFNWYFFVWTSFWMYSNVKKEMFWILKKIRNKRIFSRFWFSQIQDVNFFTFEYIRKLPKKVKSIGWNQSRWGLEEKSCLLAEVLTVFQRVTNFCTSSRPANSLINLFEHVRTVQWNILEQSYCYSTVLTTAMCIPTGFVSF